MTLHLLLLKLCQSWRIPHNAWAIYRSMLLKIFNWSITNSRRAEPHTLSLAPHSRDVRGSWNEPAQSTSFLRSSVLAEIVSWIVHSCSGSSGLGFEVTCVSKGKRPIPCYLSSVSHQTVLQSEYQVLSLIWQDTLKPGVLLLVLRTEEIAKGEDGCEFSQAEGFEKIQISYIKVKRRECSTQWLYSAS